jgi:hypothetical protein
LRCDDRLAVRASKAQTPARRAFAGIPLPGRNAEARLSKRSRSRRIGRRLGRARWAGRRRGTGDKSSIEMNVGSPPW